MQCSVMQGVKVMLLSSYSKGQGRFKQFISPKVTFIINPSFLITNSTCLGNNKFLTFVFLPASSGEEHDEEIEETTQEWKTFGLTGETGLLFMACSAFLNFNN